MICCFNDTVQDSTHPTHSLASRLSYGLVLATTVLAPLLVVPVFTNFMVTTKLLVLSVAAVLLIGVFVYHTVKNRVLEVPRSPLIPGLLFFGAAVLASTLLTTRYPVENLLGMGGALIAFVVITVVGALLIKARSTQDFLTVFNATIVILAVVTLLQAVGFGPTRIINSALQLNLPNTGMFSLTGSPFVAAQVFGLAVIANVIALIKQRKAEPITLAATVAGVIGFVVSLLLVLPGKEAAPLLLPFGASWTIAVDVLKAPRSALIGVGPENYSSAYQQLKPVWVNTTEWWNNTFGQASDVPLTLLTTTGLFGFGAWLLLFIKTINYGRTQFKQEPALVSLILGIFVLQIVFPINMVLLAVQAAALAFLIANRQAHSNISIHLFKVEKRSDTYELPARQQHLALALLPLILSGVVALVGMYGVGRAYAASYAFFQSSIALQANDAVKTYEYQQRATELNPYLPAFRSNFALTNLAIATALSNKTDATEQERQQVTQLIQQSIREARAASLLRPDDSTTWQTLGQIYRTLIGAAEGADQWASSAYVQAISTNPNNPTLRVELGGMLVGLQQYNDANLLFQQAAELKPDLANAYYNLANSLRLSGQLEQSKLAYQKTLTLIPANSEDYTRANQELETLEKEIQTAADAAAKNKTNSPAATPVPGQQNQIPSIINQNVTEPDQSVVTQPSASDLNVEQTPVTEPSPEASPAP